MKPKNVMLLGFVNKAVDYLDKHMDEEPDTRLAELKNIDLASLKDELSDNLDASLGTMQSTMTTLLKAGNEAFDKFIEDNLGRQQSIPDQFNKLFDIDFDEDKKNNQAELARLLSFYNLENDFDVDDSQEIGAPIEDEQDYVDEIQDEELVNAVKKTATNDDIEEIVPIERNEKQDAEIDSIFSEIVENENKPVEIIEETKEEPVQVEETKEEPVQVQETKSYVSSLIDDLRTQLVREEEAKKAKAEKDNDIFVRINKIYPYLPEGFVRSVYELKESLASEYRIGSKLIVLHRILFKDVENLRKFVEIGLNHEYAINADENKMIVDIFKEFTNTDGKILTNIYEVANQGYLLNGTYEGYNVVVQED